VIDHTEIPGSFHTAKSVEGADCIHNCQSPAAAVAAGYNLRSHTVAVHSPMVIFRAPAATVGVDIDLGLAPGSLEKLSFRNPVDRMVGSQTGRHTAGQEVGHHTEVAGVHHIRRIHRVHCGPVATRPVDRHSALAPCASSSPPSRAFSSPYTRYRSRSTHLPTYAYDVDSCGDRHHYHSGDETGTLRRTDVCGRVFPWCGLFEGKFLDCRSLHVGRSGWEEANWSSGVVKESFISRGDEAMGILHMMDGGVDFRVGTCAYVCM
jgi:hypothetical protein